MGASMCMSKEEALKKKKIDDAKCVYDPRLIYYDDDGNLRYGITFCYYINNFGNSTSKLSHNLKQKSSFKDEDGQRIRTDPEIKDIMSTDDIIEQVPFLNELLFSYLN